MARSFAIDAIELVANANLPVVWALTPQLMSTREHASVDVLKHLVSQAIQRNTTLHSERAAVLSAIRFQAAVTDRDWFDLLASVLDGIPQMYMIIDLSILEFDPDGGEFWPMLFGHMFEQLATRGLQTIVKVAFVCQSLQQKDKLGDSDQVQKLSISGFTPGKVTKPYRKSSSRQFKKRGVLF